MNLRRLVGTLQQWKEPGGSTPPGSLSPLPSLAVTRLGLATK